MDDMLALSIAFLVMLNPFALFVCLEPLRRNMEKAGFRTMLRKASINSAVILIFFTLAGNFLFTMVFQIDFEAFRIFGGIIIFTFAFLFVVKDRKTLIQAKQNINDLAMDVSVPFMVGAGSISFAILVGQAAPHPALGILQILIILLVNYVLIIGLGYGRFLFFRNPQAFDNYMDAVMRVNIFIIGAIGVDMIVTGMQNLFEW